MRLLFTSLLSSLFIFAIYIICIITYLLIIIIKFQLSSNVYYERTFINLFILKLNKHATTQSYTIIKNCNKINKQNVRIKY